MDTRVALRSCVRVRPLSSEEEADGERSAWAVRGSSLRLLPKELQADGRAGWLADSEYSFDAAFGPEMGTHAVYAAAAGDVASTILSGTSCTLIAFGQTASGKTYTMLGSTAAHSASRNSANTSTPGLVVLAFRDIATRSEESSRLAGSVLGKSQHYRVKASCVEIYNEQCNDLLAINQRNLKLYEAPGGAQVVQNLTEVNIATETELLECMQVAQAQRRVGSTQNNDRSSRSHLIFSISVESWTIPSRQSDAYEAPMGKDESLTHTSTLRLADLAGSERVGVSRRQVEVASAQNASDVLQRESSQINKSLLTLSTIVHRLAEGTHAQHLPYRDSKLTRLLQPCLGGSARAILISTITPSSRHVEESLNTLRFASRARRIRSISEAHSGSGPSQALVDKLSVEVALLRAQLQQHQGSSPLSVSLSSEPIEQDRANSALTSDAPLSSKGRFVHTGIAPSAAKSIAIEMEAPGTPRRFRRGATFSAGRGGEPRRTADLAGQGPCGPVGSTKRSPPQVTDSRSTSVGTESEHYLPEKGPISWADVCPPGTLKVGILGLEHAAQLRSQADEFTAKLTSVLEQLAQMVKASSQRKGQCASSRASAASARTAVGYSTAASQAQGKLPVAARLGHSDGRPLDGVLVASADHMLLEMLESEATKLLGSCANGIAQLLQLMQEVQAAATVSGATPMGAEAKEHSALQKLKSDSSGAGQGQAAMLMLADERIRTVRRTKDIFAAQHDMLCQFMLQRLGSPRPSQRAAASAKSLTVPVD